MLENDERDYAARNAGRDEDDDGLYILIYEHTYICTCVRAHI